MDDLSIAQQDDGKTIKRTSRIAYAAILVWLLGLLLGGLLTALGVNKVIANWFFFLTLVVSGVLGIISLCTMFIRRETFTVRGVVYAIIAILFSIAFLQEYLYVYLQHLDK